MRNVRPSSRQLIASWITGAIAIAAVWWAFSAWEGRQRAYTESDLDLATTLANQASTMSDSAMRVTLLEGTVKLQNIALARALAYREQRPTYHAAAVAGTVV